MDRKGILLDLRNEGKLKGIKPAFVTLRPNMGKIYNGGSGTFIMSIRNDVLHFQKLSFFIHRLVPGDDFEVNAKRFTEYKLDRRTALAILYLYDSEGRFLQIVYQIGTRETFATEDNISRILKELEEKYGLKQVGDNYGEEPNNEGEKSDKEV